MDVEEQGEVPAVASTENEALQDDATLNEENIPVDDADGGEQGEESPKQHSRGVQKRIDELTKARREAERHNLELMARLAAIEAVQKPQAPQVEAPKNTPPKIDDFDSDEAYIEARIDFELARKERSLEEKRLQKQQQSEAQEAQARFIEQAQQMRKIADDFDDAIGSTGVLPEHVIGAILQAENSAAVSYHLAKNKALLNKISGLNPLRAALEIGKIEASLKPAAARKAPPAPLAPVSGKGSGMGGKALQDLSMEEYAKVRGGL